MTVVYCHEIQSPFSSSSLNSFQISCPCCHSILLKPNSAEFILQESSPKLPHMGKTIEFEPQTIQTGFWKVENMMQFENVGFSNPNKQQLRYLCCADCEIVCMNKIQIRVLWAINPMEIHVALLLKIVYVIKFKNLAILVLFLVEKWVFRVLPNHPNLFLLYFVLNHLNP